MISRLRSKLISLHRIAAEMRFVSRPEPNPMVFEKLMRVWDQRSQARDISLSLETLTAGSIAGVHPLSDWRSCGENEYVLHMHSCVFANFEIRLFLPKGATRLVIYLPGSLTSVDQIFDVTDSNFHLRDLAIRNNIGLCSWNWPMQGDRLQSGIYRNAAGHDQLAKEYVRIFPILGTSLFAEYLVEMKACLTAIVAFVGQNHEVIVAGWSQGGWFSYFAPLLHPAVKRVTAAGSCAAYRDLLAEGCGHIHGYFMYPFFSGASFDLEDVCRETASRVPLHIVCGDDDRGCLNATIQRIKGIPGVTVSVLPGYGHSFTGAIREIVTRDLFS